MKWVQKITSIFITKPLLWLFFNVKIVNLKKIKEIKPPLLIIGNHKTSWDTFALGAILPFKTKLLPIRIMGEIDFFYNSVLESLRKIGIIKLVYTIFGVFPAIRGKGLNIALEEPTNILRKNGVIFIHPEGEIKERNEIGKFKIGAAALALETKVKILPVVFKIRRAGFRKEYFIKFGDVFSLPEELTIGKGADYMRKIILDLYKSTS